MWQLLTRSCTCCSDATAREIVEQFDENGLLQVHGEDCEEGAALPQILKQTDDPDIHEDGVVFGEVWPEHWGVTIGQFREFLNNCQQDSEWDSDYTMRELVDKYMVPATRGKGMGYALLANSRAPKAVNVIVSNCWLDNAEALCEKLERVVKPDHGLFITALALYQCEDGYGPTIQQQLGTDFYTSPFMRVLNRLKRSGDCHGPVWHWQQEIELLPAVLMVLALFCLALPILALGCVPVGGKCAVGSGEPLEWMPILIIWRWRFADMDRWVQVLESWCVVFVMVAALLKAIISIRPVFVGRLVAIPNHRCDLYHEGKDWTTGCSCTHQTCEDEDGICIVKLEIMTTRSLGVPIQVTSSFAPAANEQEGRGESCSTKAETKYIVDDSEEAMIDLGHEEASWQYVKANRTAQSVVVEAQRLQMLRCALWGGALSLSSACAIRLGCIGLGDSLGDLGLGALLPRIHEAIWCWSLILGEVAGGIATAGAMLHVAVNAHGETTSQGWLFLLLRFLAAAFSIMLVLLIVSQSGLLGKQLGSEQHVTLGDYSWLLIGVAFALMQGVGVISVLLLWLKYECSRRLTDSQGARMVVATASLGALAAATTASSTSLRLDQLFPTFVTVVLSLAGLFVGPVVAAWSAASAWGMHLDRGRRS